MKDWEKIFIMSPVNGALYYEPEQNYWPWPTGTWFQKRRMIVGIIKEQEEPKKEESC